MVKQHLENIWQGFKRFIVIGILIAIWQALPSIGIIDARSLPPFSEVIKGLVQLIVSGELADDFLASLQRSVSGFVLATAVAIPLGFLMGWFKRFERIADPLIQICRNTATLALYPVFILVFGLGELSKIGIIFWGSIWPILINTIDGVRSVEPILIKSAKSMSTPNLTLFRKVIFPAAVPSIITGLRISATRAVVILVAAEMLGAQAGLGFLIFDARNKYEVPTMYAGILVLIMLGMTVNYLIVGLEKQVTRWKGNVEEV